MKTDIFQSCGHCYSFPDLLVYWVQHFNTSSFRIWASSAGIPSPLPALFVVMLPKAHLTLHYTMSGSSWVTKPSWLAGSLRPLFYSSSVHSCHLFLIPSAFVRSFPFLSFIVPIFEWNIPLVSPSFLEEITIFPWYLPVFLKRLLVFSILLFFSIYLQCSLKKAFLSLLAVLWNSAFIWVYLPFLLCLSLFFSQPFVRPPQTITLPSCISFSWRWFW